MVIGLVRACLNEGSTRIIHPHFYAFGGVMATARWLRGLVDGAFDLDADGSKFTVTA